MKPRRALHSTLAAAAFAASAANAVYLNPDGTGEALIYPYYTVQSAAGNAFNTYVSIVNHASDAKVVKLRFREGRNGKPVLDLDLYLAPDDMWTGAVVPSTAEAGAAARLVSADLSCTNPVMPGGGLEFDTDSLVSDPDGAGTGTERTREGFFEAIEMATLTGSSATAVSHNASGIPVNCAAVQGSNPPLAVDAPSGGLSGTVTLINVTNGMDFGINAEALEDLATREMYHSPSDPTPVDFNAPEIDAVSQVIANGFLYRSFWQRPVDAVSAVLMRSTWAGELVLDTLTNSQTDVVVVFPTRQNYATPMSVVPPFSRPFDWFPLCAAQTGTPGGEPVTLNVFDREAASRLGAADFATPRVPQPPATLCAAASIVSLVNANAGGSSSRVFGSVNLGLGGAPLALSSTFQDGRFTLAASSGYILASMGNSTRTSLATGEVVVGSHSYRGLPVTGFWAGTFQNGLINCGGTACQGNYGSAFPLAYRRSISP